MKVIREFKCLRSGRLYLAGTDYPESDPERVNELAKKGFLAGKLPVPVKEAPNAGAGKTGAAKKKRSI